MQKRTGRKKLPVVLTEAEVEALREQCTRSATGLRNRAMVEIMVGAGLRLSEVIDLRPSDIDWEVGQIRVNNGKGGRDRVVPVNGDTLAHLQVWASKRESLGYNGRHPFFFGIRTKGRALTPQNIQQMIGAMGEKAGIAKKVHPHVLRHTYATLTLRSPNVDIREVQDALGHSNVSTTMIYTHVDPEAFRRKIQGTPKADKLDALQLAQKLQELDPEAREALAALLGNA